MLRTKFNNKRIATDEMRANEPKFNDPEILICLNCPLPQCVKGFECARFKDERNKLRRKGYGKRNKKKD